MQGLPPDLDHGSANKRPNRNGWRRGLHLLGASQLATLRSGMDWEASALDRLRMLAC